jgi:hypothetical protein
MAPQDPQEEKLREKKSNKIKNILEKDIVVFKIYTVILSKKTIY